MRQLTLWGPACPPTLSTVTASLRALNRVYPRKCTVKLGAGGLVASPDGDFSRVKTRMFGCEPIPGGNRRFDAVGAARRLLAAYRAEEITP